MPDKVINKNINIEIINNKPKKISNEDEQIIYNLLKNKYKKKINEQKKILEILEYNKIIKQKELEDRFKNISIDIENQQKEIKKKLNYCQICFDNDIDTVLVPCGHSYCNECIKNSNACFFCRANISKKQHIIFS